MLEESELDARDTPCSVLEVRSKLIVLDVLRSRSSILELFRKSQELLSSLLPPFFLREKRPHDTLPSSSFILAFAGDQSASSENCSSPVRDGDPSVQRASRRSASAEGPAAARCRTAIVGGIMELRRNRGRLSGVAR